MSNTFHVQAHRGACAEYLENTLPAFARAIEVGADSIELDVHMTKDGHLVLYHDFELDARYCRDREGNFLKSNIPIRSLTLKEIKEMDPVDDRRIRVKNPQSIDERRIPTLEEVFQLFQNSKHPNARRMIIDIEVKSEPDHPEWSPDPKTFAKAVLDSVRKNWNFEQTAVRSFDHRVLEEVKKVKPDLTIAALTDTGFKDFERVARELKPAVLSPEKDSISKDEVAKVQSYGVKVIPFTVNEPADWERMFALGMDGVTTDNPKALIAYLKSKGLRTLNLKDFKARVCGNALSKAGS